MRICLVASSRYPIVEPFAGGLEAHTASLARGLRRRGHDVSVFAAPGSDPTLGVTDLPVRSFASSASARRDVNAPPEPWMADHHAYLGLMLDLAADGPERFDVVHNNSLHHLPIAMASATRLPLVTTLHTPPVPWLESAAAYAPEEARWIAVSEHTSDAWSHLVDSCVVRNGVDTDRWRPGPGGPRAVWTGRLVPEKAPHLAIRAARAAGLAIDLAGPRSDPDYVRREIEPLLDHDVRYLGHLTSEQLVHHVGRAAVAVVSPVWNEPYGLVAAEAMACGTPVAAFARGGLVEVVDGGTGRLAAPDDVASLADAITSASRLDRGAVRRRAVRRLGVDAMVDRYEAVYASVVARAAA